MKIKNYPQLAVTETRAIALEIAEAGLQAIDTERAIHEIVSLSDDMLVIDGEKTPLEGIGRIIVAGIGKCAARAAAELEKILGNRLSGGLVITIGEVPPLAKIKSYFGTHPFPSKKNMEASEVLLKSLSNLEEKDLVIFLVSGGGSTLLCLPDDGNWQRESLILGAFMNSGAPIQDINTVRKHMSRVRGGFLARAMYPARVISLIFNDVPGSDDVGFIASGPTVKDTTTVGDAQAILDKYKILMACNLDGCGLLETPKEDKYFDRVKNIVVVSNKTALDAIKQAGEKKGYKTEVIDAKIAGEAHDIGRSIADRVVSAPPHTILLWGGETTVTVHKSGKGGRLQELAIGALMTISDDVLLMAVASDGRDNTDIGGVLCDKIVKDKASKLGLNPQQALDENQSYQFWKTLGEYLDIGETGSNVSDLIIALKE
jgi:glycerate 2-kinase